MRLTDKYWQQIMRVDTYSNPVRQCHEWQKGNMRLESWLKERERDDSE